MNGLLRTYLEELGGGDASKNHVLLYRKLLEYHGLEQWQDLPDEYYIQGAIQLSLGMHGDVLLPEMVGFNLGYEQLPLHLLICSYELNELRIDPYYFQLHIYKWITVTQAMQNEPYRSVHELLPLLGDKADYQSRVRRGYLLNSLGVGTSDVIANYDTKTEVVSIFQRKSLMGSGAHSDYCKIAGRTVNEWLGEPSQIPDFLESIETCGLDVFARRNARKQPILAFAPGSAS